MAKDANILISEQWNSSLIEFVKPNVDYVLPLDIRVMATTMEEIWGAKWIKKQISKTWGENWCFETPWTDEEQNFSRYLKIDVDLDIDVREGHYSSFKSFLLKGATAKASIHVLSNMTGKVSRIDTIYRPSQWYTDADDVKVNIASGFQLCMREKILDMQKKDRLFITFGVFSPYEKAWREEAYPTIREKKAKCIITTLAPAYPDNPLEA